MEDRVSVSIRVRASTTKELPRKVAGFCSYRPLGTCSPV